MFLASGTDAVAWRLPPELRWQSGRLLTDRSLVRSQVVALASFLCGPAVGGPKERASRFEDTTSPWRNGSASDSRPEGWGFKSLWVHSFASRAPLAERSAVNRQVLGSIPSGGGSFCNRCYFFLCWCRRRPRWTSLWPNWIRRLTTNQKIGGSSPSRDISGALSLHGLMDKAHPS